MALNSSQTNRSKKMLYIAFFMIALFSICFSLALRKVHAQTRGERLFEYKALLTSISDGTLPYPFLAHRQNDREFLRSLKRNLHSARLNNKTVDKEYTKKKSIPKIIHQLWLFNEEPPQEVQYAMATVQAQNPSYTYYFWTKDALRKRLQPFFGEYFDHLCDYVAVSDYAAALILKEFGGYIIDPWIEALAPLESMNIPDTVQLMIGIEPPLGSIHFGKRRVYASPGLLAAVPNHCFMERWSKEIYNRLGILIMPQHENWSSDCLYERMVWTSLESLTDLMSELSSQDGKVLSEVVAIGPTVWCPIRPKHIQEYHKFVSGELHKSVVKKVTDILHISQPPFSSVGFDSIFVHLTGGRLGLTKKNIKKYIDGNSRLFQVGELYNSNNRVVYREAI